MISTDIPASEVDTFLALALKAKSQPVATLSLVPPLVDTGHPDIAMIKRKVGKAIAASEHPAAHSTAHRAGRHREKTSGPVTGGSIGSLSTGYAANDSTDLTRAC
jgi:hypothetical protein